MPYQNNRIRHADFYAHFSPVGLINHKRLLSDFDNYCDDTVGTTKSIWERIKKVGEKKFYRVEYFDGEDNLTELDKRIEQKDYVESEGAKLLIDTAIADTEYISNVIKAHVEKDVEASKRLYEEPSLSDKDQANLDKLLRQFGQTQKSWGITTPDNENEKLLKENQAKKDNTNVKLPNQPLKNN